MILLSKYTHLLIERSVFKSSWGGDVDKNLIAPNPIHSNFKFLHFCINSSCTYYIQITLALFNLKINIFLTVRIVKIEIKVTY